MESPTTVPLRAAAPPPAKPTAPPRGAKTFRIPLAARIIIAAIVVVLIVLIAILSPRVRDFEKFLSGVWVGDSTFLKEAGLSELYLYIAPCERVGGRWCRQGYLVMVDTQGGMVSNQGIEVDYGCLFGRWKSALKSHFTADAQETYRVPCADITYDDSAVMPERLCLGLNVTEGTLALYNEEKIYAFLVKDNETSIAANAQYCDDGVVDKAPKGS